MKFEEFVAELKSNHKLPQRYDPVPDRPNVNKYRVQLTKEQKALLFKHFPKIGSRATRQDTGIEKKLMNRYVRFGYLKEIRKVDLDPFYLFADKKTRKHQLFERIA